MGELKKLRKKLSQIKHELGRRARFFLARSFVRCPVMSGHFVRRIFLPFLAPYLGIRRNTFRKVFDMMEKQKRKYYYIVETGTARGGARAVGNDGASSILFDAFVNCHDGEVKSIDIDPAAVKKVRGIVSSKTKVICSDTLDELGKIEHPIDLIYLDSLDIDWNNPKPAAAHTYQEFKLVEDKLKAGAIIIIDDSPLTPAHLPPWTLDRIRNGENVHWSMGKGLVLIPYLDEHPEYTKVAHEYQCVFVKNDAAGSAA